MKLLAPKKGMTTLHPSLLLLFLDPGSGMQLFSVVFIRLFLQFVAVFATSVVY